MSRRQKVCSMCGKLLALSAFHRNKRKKDGRDPACKECNNRRQRLAYAANPQKKIAQTRRYHLEHPEWSKERLRAHHVAHKDERYQRYVDRGKDPRIAAKRREATRRSESRRRALKRGLEAELISEFQFALRLEEFDGKCYICGEILGADLHWDHFRPLTAGGRHVLSNLFPACDLCNVRKNSCWPFTEKRRKEIAEEVRALRKQSVSKPERR
jgi:hypothetical protein